jgi:thiol:disulfide interchange protein/DsbC/DsbD-like thiol-disulfide interchange protein
MIANLCRMMTLLLALLAMPASAQAPHLTPALIAERSDPRAGTTATVAINFVTEPGWHGYWRNPGEAGFAPRLAWHAPVGVSFGEPDYPVPSVLTVAGLVNHVFDRDHALLVPMTLPAALARGTRLPVRLDAQWLACTDQICVPERATLNLMVTVGDGTSAPDPRFASWRAALPTPLDRPVTLARAGSQVRVAIPFPASAALERPHIFAGQAGAIDEAAPQAFARDGDTLIATLRAGGGASTMHDGIVTIGGDRALAFTTRAGPVASGGTPVSARRATEWTMVVGALGAAVLGGLLLNVMPCVFPILSLKALSLARAGGDERAARHDALAYAAGAIAVTLALGAAILVLRAGGSAIGWAFQLQDPRVIVVLLVLMTALALNLAGLFELPVAAGGGARGGFATGALAAFVATPCTGPFMGAALGAALVLPPVAALAVFAGLGLGLALPFVAIGFVPALRRRLPRPGAWLATFRHVLSVPMFATALGLAWLLGRQAGSDAVVVAIGAALCGALALWWAGAHQRRGRAGLGAAAALATVAALIGAAALPVAVPLAAPSAAGAVVFSEAGLAALREQGKPVFLYFTADWCLTCKVNERVVIDRADTRAAFARGGVVTMVGDWTRPDAAIARFLAAHGRSGVPLYLFYPAGGGEPRELPQVLTPAMLTAL